MEIAAAREVLIQSHYCVVATASSGGEPWLSIVFFNYDASYTLVWESARSSGHAQLMAANPRVSFYIAQGKKIGATLYATGLAHEATPDELAQRLDTFLNGPHRRDDPQRTVEDYAEGSPVGLYVAELEALWCLKQKQVGKYVLEEREALDLASLRARS